jgi:hypothetical protein
MSFVRSAPLALVLFVLGAPPALGQGLPDPRYTTIDAVVVANTSGTPIGSIPPGFDVTMKDLNNAPLAGIVVTLDFSASSIRLFAIQNAGTILDCAARTVSRVTNSSGAVNFAVRLGGYDNTSVVFVRGNGEQFGPVPVRSTDLDGLDGMTGLGDFALFADNFLTATAAKETDFDLGGTTGLGDFVIFAAEFLGGAAHSYCP